LNGHVGGQYFSIKTFPLTNEGRKIKKDAAGEYSGDGRRRGGGEEK